MPPDPSPATAPPATDHLDVLDGLRGVAILWVLAFHVWQLSWLPQQLTIAGWTCQFTHLTETGFSGVELFFFISGFCLLWPFVRALRQGTPAPSWRHYASRRAIKILPSYWLSIVLMLLIARPAWLSDPAQALWNLTAHAFFFQNISPQAETAVNGVLWSLGVEVQFYLIFPLLAWAFVRRPAWTWVGLCGAAIAWRHGVQTWAHPHFHWLMQQLPAYLDLFATGMLGAWLQGRRAPSAPAGLLARGLATAIALGALWAVHSYALGLWQVRHDGGDWPNGYQVAHRWHLALAFLLLTLASMRAWPFWQRLFTWRPLLWLSVISYNLYLWHQFVGRQFMYVWKWPVPATSDPHHDPVWQLSFTIVTIAASLAVAAAITYGFERPLLRGGWAALRDQWRRPR
ncbi:MAG: acyltransferase [Candidatus Sericytochromatia bacterium]|nr:acyltransferase [Candidatus Sericytochromatia bacterium]